MRVFVAVFGSFACNADAPTYPCAVLAEWGFLIV